MTVRGSAARSLSCSIAGALHYEIQLGGPKRGSRACKRFLQTASEASSGGCYIKGLGTGSEPSGATEPRGPDDSDGQRCSVPGGGDGGRLRQAAAGAGGLALEELQAPAEARAHTLAPARAHTRSRPHTHARTRTHKSARTTARTLPLPQTANPTHPPTNIHRADGHISFIDFHHRQVLSLGIGSAYLAAVSCDMRIARVYAQAPAHSHGGAHAQRRARSATRPRTGTHTARANARTEAIARGGDCRRRHAGASRAPACLSMQAPVRPATCARARARRRIATAPGG